MPANIYANRRLIAKLAYNDFRVRYAGSYFGIFWAFVQPVITILVYWFVFSVGFRQSTAGFDVPFVLYLVAGIVPWFFFQDCLVGGTNALLEYNYLVKKVVFNIRILPVVKLVSAGFVHSFFVMFTLVLFLLYGRFPGFYIIQMVYYSFCCVALTLGLCYMTCSVVVFFRDLTQMIQILLQVGVWLTPIMWVADVSLAGHPVIHSILKLNPVYYIVSGYRDCLILRRPFWEAGGWTVYFWVFTFASYCLGNVVFERLRPHFADVL